MTDCMRRIRLNAEENEPSDRAEFLLTREWLVTNGLGGYASGTLGGVLTRRYHGLLVAALAAPLGRTMMVNHLSEYVQFSDRKIVGLGGEERAGGSLELAGAPYHSEFRLEMGLPVWRFEIDGTVIEKRLFLRHLQNTVQVMYQLMKGEEGVQLILYPSLHFRSHEVPVDTPLIESYTLTACDERIEVTAPSNFPPLRLFLYGAQKTFTIDAKVVHGFLYRVEQSHGDEPIGDLWNPGYFSVKLSIDHNVVLIASTEAWEPLLAISPEDAFINEQNRRQILIRNAHPKLHHGMGAELVLAADQFIISPAGRVEAALAAHAVGEEARTVIAGYHWFTDWGRDTMISLEGLALLTGRHVEAAWILRTFAHYIKDGLIPNMFPEGENAGRYHTADATLWFFHALQRYLEFTHDRTLLKLILPKLIDIVEHHFYGTRFGIAMDFRDGLLCQGAPGYQLTWMDAKVGDWVVTPRRGKAVEINALWYNALRLLANWLREDEGEGAAAPFAQAAARVRQVFNDRFWYPQGNYLYDVVDGEAGEDCACRPNQLLAISLAHPVLDPSRWKRVLQVVREQLFTPVGLRSLAMNHPDYKPTYYGDRRARDAAYHQGTVWAWLVGPFIDAWLKVYPRDRRGARHFLEGFHAHLNEACIGSISEVFDAQPPFAPRGCIAQAWSVAEVLRCWVLTQD